MESSACERARLRFSDFLADEIGREELALLESHLAECAACRGIGEEIARLELALSSVAARDSVQGMVDRLRGALVTAPKPIASARSGARRSSAFQWWGILAASALVGAILILAKAASGPGQAAEVARLEFVEGEAYILKEEASVPAKAGDALLSGRGLRTAGKGSRLILRYPDSTSIELGPDAEARDFSDQPDIGKSWSLSRGLSTADVARQAKGRPMVVRTPQAEATVLGTTLRLEVDPTSGGSTSLLVIEGAVRITRLADGKAIDVAGGHEARVAVGVDLMAVPAQDKTRSRETADPAQWRQEQWTLEDFTAAVAGGPGIGPALQSGSSAIALCGDKAGRLYLLNGNTIDIITAQGFRTRLAGTGVQGYRDGPANQAQFDQGGSYNVPRSIQCDDLGNIYTAENGNNRVRRVFKSGDGKWMVETVAGGGKRRLKEGESCAPTEVDLASGIAVVASPNGALAIGQREGGFYRVTPDRTKIIHLGGWPATSRGALVGSDGDLHGNAYFIWRRDDGGVVKVSAEGKISPLGGMMYEEMAKLGRHKIGSPKPLHIGDGPPLEIYIDTPSSIAANPDGTCVYSCGGDEYYIRRIPTDLKSTTSTLMQNGRWYVLPVHPKQVGNGPFDPGKNGKSKAEGGPLAGLYNCHIVGRDYEGNLYGFLYSWCGDTQTLAGKGPLSTKIYRFRRIQ